MDSLAEKRKRYGYHTEKDKTNAKTIGASAQLQFLFVPYIGTFVYGYP